MRREDISDSLNMLDDDLIAETEKVRNQALESSDVIDEKPVNVRKIWMKWGTLAACLCVVVLLSVVLTHMIDKDTSVTDITNIADNQIEEDTIHPDGNDNPVHEEASGTTELAYAPDGLQILEFRYVYEGGSFEGLMYPNEYELYEMNMASNPWNNQLEFDTLPVYKDLAHAENGVGIALDKDSLYAMADDVAIAIGAKILETKEETFKLDGVWIINAIHVEADIAQFSVYADGDVTIRYTKYGEIETCMKLPGTIDNSNKKDVVEYWAETTAEITGISEYATVITSDYDFEENLHSSYGIYDASGDDVQDVLNYTYKNVSFDLDDAGNLEALSYENELAYTEKTGDYPIIAAEEANVLLMEGKYVTSVPYEISGEEHVVSVELTYRSAQYGEFLIPYYRFYVEIPEEKHSDLNCYGAYYVPAIKQDYISENQVYDGALN